MALCWTFCQISFEICTSGSEASCRSRNEVTPILTAIQVTEHSEYSRDSRDPGSQAGIRPILAELILNPRL